METAPIAVIVCRTEHGTHAGLLHPDEADATAVLHLAWHHILECDPLGGEDWSKAVWVAPSLEPERAEAIGALARRVWARHRARGLRYALRYVNAQFDPISGDLALDADGLGFTCATFVLALFKSSGIELLRKDEWETHAGDVHWQVTILGVLARTGASEDHLVRVAGEIAARSVRFRPSDVIAGAAGDTLPVGFAEATAVGQRAEALLDEPEDGGDAPSS